jgi:predicted nuclease of restriction endonuclease-like (RecB) superfamily
MSDDLLPINGAYALFLEELKARIKTAQVRAALSINQEMVLLYWQIGRAIAEKQQQYGWGEKMLERLAADLQSFYPGIEGFSRRNLYRMRAFYRAYPDETEFVTQAVSQIPWGHNIALFQMVKESEERLWYARKSIEHGWSRNVLTH